MGKTREVGTVTAPGNAAIVSTGRHVTVTPQPHASQSSANVKKIEPMPDPHPIDASVKALLRRVPEVMVRLAGIEPVPERIRFEDTAINLPEYRADHVLILGAAGDEDRGALHFEHQLRPDPDKIPGWELKRCALRAHLNMPVVLVVLYLEKGDRATFPNRSTDTLCGLRNEFEFASIRLWEHADRIRDGDLWELAPLLVLCEDNPGEDTIRTELRIIQNSGADDATQAYLLAVALRVGGRRLPRPLLEAIFRKELPMVKGATIIDDWIQEGEARGEARGETRGRTEEARRMLLTVLRARFGELPDAMASQIQAADAEWCEALLLQTMRVESLAELRW